MAVIDALLTRLECVRQVAPERWRSRCPAHEGANRSILSIAQTREGVVLLHCFHGCAPSAIVAAVGLELSDLFPPRDEHHARLRYMPRVDWAGAMLACERDLLLTHVVLEDLSQGKSISPEDVAACRRAAERVLNVLQEARNG